jgi:hypothetical protein
MYITRRSERHHTETTHTTRYYTTTIWEKSIYICLCYWIICLFGCPVSGYRVIVNLNNLWVLLVFILLKLNMHALLHLIGGLA